MNASPARACSSTTTAFWSTPTRVSTRRGAGGPATAACRPSEVTAMVHGRRSADTVALLVTTRRSGPRRSAEIDRLEIEAAGHHDRAARRPRPPHGPAARAVGPS